MTKKKKSRLEERIEEFNQLGEDTDTSALLRMLAEDLAESKTVVVEDVDLNRREARRRQALE
jgi:formate dehydrogenase maturation protein FdhE